MIEWKKATLSQTLVPVIDGQALASLRSPEDEATKWLQSIRVKDGTAVAILGFGSGVHVERFGTSYPNCKLIVYELHPELNIETPNVAVDEIDQVIEFRPAWGSMKQQYLELKTLLLGEYASFQEFVGTLEDGDQHAARVIQEFIR